MSQPNEEINLQYFKSTIKQYIKIDNEIKALSSAVKQRKDKLSGLKQILFTFLKNHDIANVELQGSHKGKEIVQYESERKVNATSSTILKILNEKLKDTPELLKSINDELEKHSKKVESQTVKIKKKPKKKVKVNAKKKSSDLSNELLNTTIRKDENSVT
jgi:uncharacterized protein YukE